MAAISQAEWDAVFADATGVTVAEAIAESKPMAVRYKAHKRGKVRMSMQPDPIERVEFEPDNSRIGRESYGLQSKSRVALMLEHGASLDAVARMMVVEYHDLVQGLIAPIAVCSCTLFAEPEVTPSKPIGCETFPALMAGTIHPFEQFKTLHIDQKPAPKQITAARHEAKKWKTERIPKYGQRPQVLMPLRSL